MNCAAWEALLRHIPRDIYPKLMLVTASGTEITIQTLLRIDREFVALKGRLSGTQDAGRLFFLPYAAIDYLGFQQGVKDTEFAEWFGSLVVPAHTPSEDQPALPPDGPAAAAPEATAPPEAAPPTTASGNSKTVNPVVKSAVLEKFRARSHSSGVRPRVTLPPPQK